MPTSSARPPDPTSVAAWSGAVEAGARGWYSAAFTGARALRSDPDPVVRSLSASLEGSLLRQLGRHDAASVRDGLALRESGLGRGALQPRAVDAVVDALVGLAADAIGPRRTSRADVLLARAEDVLTEHPGHCRVWLRVWWVRAEVAMARGDGPSALSAASRAVDASQAFASDRHRIKSRLVLCAARLVAGDHGAAAVDARSVRVDAEALGLLPLAWAAASISEALGETGAATVRGALEVAIRSRGGVFS